MNISLFQHFYKTWSWVNIFFVLCLSSLKHVYNLNAQTSGTFFKADNPRFLGATSAGIRVTASLPSVPLDIFDLVTSTLRLRRGASSDASEALTQIIEFLDSLAQGSFPDLLDHDFDIETTHGLDDSLHSAAAAAATAAAATAEFQAKVNNMADWDEQNEASTLRSDIQTIINALDKHHKNVNISRVTGSSVAIATGVPAAACAIAAPFTLGVTLIPAIVLGIVAAVGGGVSVGASITEIFIKRHNVKEVQARWETFRQGYLARHRENTETRDILSLNAKSCGTSTNVGTAVQDAAEAVRSASGISSAVVKGAFQSASAGVRITAPLLSVASVVALPLDIIDLVTASLRLRRGERSPASESLMQIVNFLNTVASNDHDHDHDIERALGLVGEDDLDLFMDDELNSGNRNNHHPLFAHANNFFVSSSKS